MTHELETFRKAFDFALERLANDLKDAQHALGQGEDNQTIGILIDVEDRVADMLAARRLFISSRRRA